MREFSGGVGLALRRWPLTVAVGLALSAAALVLSFALGDVLNEVGVLKGSASLRESKAYSFRYATPGSYKATSAESDPILRYASRHIEEKRAYATVVNDAGIDTVDRKGMAGQLIIIVGDVVPSLFPDLDLCDPAPCAMRGVKVDPSTVPEVVFGSLRVPVTGLFSPKATLFDPHTAGVPLDKRVVVRLPITAIPSLSDVEKEEMIINTILLDPEQSTVDEYVALSAHYAIDLAPSDLADRQSSNMAAIVARSVMYIVSMVGFVALALTVARSMMKEALRRERRAFIIRRWSGARPADVWARITAYVMSSLLVIPSAPLLFLALLGGPWTSAALILLALLVALCSVLVVVSARSVLAAESERNLR